MGGEDHTNDYLDVLTIHNPCMIAGICKDRHVILFEAHMLSQFNLNDDSDGAASIIREMMDEGC